MTKQDRELQKKHIRHWREAAHRDQETAKSLLQSKHYDWSLFIYHLAIEKLLKAAVVSAGKRPLYTHDLEKLANQADLVIESNHQAWLREITSFNMDARYDDEKLRFYHKTTETYTKTWHQHCEELFLWLQKHIKS